MSEQHDCGSCYGLRKDLAETQKICAGLYDQMAAIAEEADKHWEHNPVSGKTIAPAGYQRIKELASMPVRTAGKTVDRAELDALRQACRYAELHLDLPHPEIEPEERAAVLKALAQALGRPNHPVRTRAADPAPTLPAQLKPENSMIDDTTTTVTGPNNAPLIHLFNELQAKAHANSRAKGFWAPYDYITDHDHPPAMKSALLTIWKLSRTALEHEELGEKTTGIRKGLMDDHLPHRSMEVCESADTIIRLMDEAGAHGWPLMEVILEKMAYNSNREFMHGKKA